MLISIVHVLMHVTEKTDIISHVINIAFFLLTVTIIMTITRLFNSHKKYWAQIITVLEMLRVK
jgi:hypothetical protein